MARKHGAVPEREVSVTTQAAANQLQLRLSRKGWTATAPAEANEVWYVTSDAPDRVLFDEAFRMGISLKVWK